jgi:hypothetical protein
MHALPETIPAPNPYLQLLRLELPEELDEALADADLHEAFARLSALQQSCYADWVGDSPFANSRWDRAHLICRVLERLP